MNGQAERDAFLDGARPNDLPMKSRRKVLAWMPPVSLRKLAPFLDGTKWTAKIAGFSLGARWGVFIIWRVPK